MQNRIFFRDCIYPAEVVDIIHLKGVAGGAPVKKAELIALSSLLQIPIFIQVAGDRSRLVLPETDSLFKVEAPNGVVLVLREEMRDMYSWVNEDMLAPHKESCKFKVGMSSQEQNPEEEVTIPWTGGEVEHPMEVVHNIQEQGQRLQQKKIGIFIKMMIGQPDLT